VLAQWEADGSNDLATAVGVAAAGVAAAHVVPGRGLREAVNGEGELGEGGTVIEGPFADGVEGGGEGQLG